MTFQELQEANNTLAMVDIKGKEYATVNQRVKAFRYLFPNGTITTDIIESGDGYVVMKATIGDESGKVIATGYARERESASFINKTSYLENCETSAIGRALGFCGIGIDTSIASYEEVVTAEINQKKASFEQLEIIRRAIKVSEVPEHKFLNTWGEKYGIKSLNDLTPEYADEIIKSISAKMPDIVAGKAFISEV